MKTNRTIKSKIIVLSVLSVFFVAVLILGIVQIEKSALQEDVDRELQELAKSETRKVATDAYLLARTFHEVLSASLEANTESAHSMLSLSTTRSKEDSTLSKKQRFSLFDKDSTNTAFSPKLALKAVISLKSLLGLDYTVYHKHPGQSQMSVVASTLSSQSLETDLIAMDSVSSQLRVYDNSGRQRLTRFVPLRDELGNVIGALAASIPESQLESVRQGIMDMVVGKTGYVYVVRGSGEHKGEYVISLGGKRDGESIWEAKDANGSLFIQSVVGKATKTREGEVDYEQYAWRNQGEANARDKLTAVTYFEPWDWVIGAGAYEDDFHAAKQRVSEALADVVLVSAIGAFVLLLLSGVVAFLISSRIANPLQRMVEAAGELAKGNINQKINVSTQDEVGALGNAFNTLIEAQQQRANVAEQISKGDLSNKVEILSKDDVLGISMNNMKSAIENLAMDINGLVDAAVEGSLDERADVTRHQGEFAACIGGVNQTVDTLVGHLDAMPAPAMIIDRDYSIQFMNESGTKVLGKPKDQIVGTKCYDNFNIDHCGTSKCACNRAMASGASVSAEANAHPSGKDLEIQYTGVPVRDLKGEVIGALEVIADQTAVKHAARVASKQADFQNAEVEKLVLNLQKVAKGDLTGSISIGSTDEDTAAIGKNFENIHNGLSDIKKNVGLLIADVNGLSTAAVNGDLSKRADISVHLGDYQAIIYGVNNTLDAIIAPITEAGEVLEQLANYDLRSRVKGDYKGDHAKIKASLNATAAALDDSMYQVKEATTQVSEASRQIASSSQQLAEGTSEQSGSLEETSSSLEEMSGMTKQNTNNTRRANSLAETTRVAANNGSSVMNAMMNAMAKIKGAAEGTAAIIKDINEIAFQTNLLALNAAVEAARAGDAGRGFAVVAEEVRNLAGRAKDAAKNTEELIKESVSLAEDGAGLSGEVNDNLGEIVNSVGEVADIVGEITAASEEQATGIEQINKAISEMDRVVQHSAASAEESSSAAEELSGQSEELFAMVGRFQLSSRESQKTEKTGMDTKNGNWRGHQEHLNTTECFD